MKFIINNERVGFIFLKPRYHAYWLSYSKGLQCLPNGKFKNLWCFPKFEIVRMPKEIFGKCMCGYCEHLRNK